MKPASLLFVVPAFLLILGGLASPSRAEVAPEPQTRHVRSPSLSGFVFDMDVPANWQMRAADGGTLTLVSPSTPDSPEYLELYIRVYSPPAGEDGSDEPTMEAALLRNALLDISWPYSDPRVFEKSKWMLGDMEMLRKDINAAKIKDAAGKMIAAPGADTWAMMGVTKREQGIYISLRARGPDALKRIAALQANQTVAERVITSFKLAQFKRLSDAEQATVPTVYGAKAARVSSRRGYYLDIAPSFFLPAGWTVHELGRQSAGRGSEKGEFALQILPPVGKDGKRPLAVGILVLEGLNVGPLSPSDYVRSAGPRIERMLPGAKLVSESRIEHPGLRMLARSNTRWTTGTGQTVVRTYELERADNEKMRLRSYTAGGMTAAAHFMIIAPAKQFAEVEAAFQPILDTFQARLTSPSIRTR